MYSPSRIHKHILPTEAVDPGSVGEEGSGPIKHLAPRIEEHIASRVHYWDLSIYPTYDRIYCLNPDNKETVI